MSPKPYEGRRDIRFVRENRGGTLTDEIHSQLALWSASCAERVLGLFELERPDDKRPRDAIEAARKWAEGKITMMEAREFAYAAHAAARDAQGAASEAARAAGHAVATAHMADHELGGAFYALRAIAKKYPSDSVALERERAWQLDTLHPDIRDLVIDDMKLRANKFQGMFAQ